MSEQRSSNLTPAPAETSHSVEAVPKLQVDIEALRLPVAEQATQQSIREVTIAQMNEIDPMVQFQVKEEAYTQYVTLSSSEFLLDGLATAGARDVVVRALESCVQYLDLPIISDNIDELPESEISRLKSVLAARGIDFTNPIYKDRHGLRRAFRKLFKQSEAYANKMKVNRLQFMSVIKFLPIVLNGEVTQLPSALAAPVEEKMAELVATAATLPDTAAIQAYNTGETQSKKEFINDVCRTTARCITLIQELLGVMSQIQNQIRKTPATA